MSKVFHFDQGDPEMQQANERARETFRYLWRELSWERRRIVPALDMACVKIPFSDGENADAEVEHMWVSDLDFDGTNITGTLINSPNTLSSVKQGDAVSSSPSEISDWMYAIRGEVFGAYTVNLMRSRMSRQERDGHDQAWGLNFGDPENVRIAGYLDAPKAKSGGLLGKLFGRKPSEPAPTEEPEHPMSINMAPKLAEHLTQNPQMANEPGEKGWTFLHSEALAGSAPTVEILLKHGADPNAKTDDGRTPLELAQVFQWTRVIQLIAAHGGQ